MAFGFDQANVLNNVLVGKVLEEVDLNLRKARESDA